MSGLYIVPANQFQGDQMIAKGHTGFLKKESFDFMCHFLGFKTPMILRNELHDHRQRFVMVDRDDQAGRHFYIYGIIPRFNPDTVWMQNYIQELIASYVPEKGLDKERDLTESLIEITDKKIVELEERWQKRFLEMESKIQKLSNVCYNCKEF